MASLAWVGFAAEQVGFVRCANANDKLAEKDIAKKSGKLLTLAMKIRLIEEVPMRADRFRDEGAVSFSARPRGKPSRIGWRALYAVVFIAGFLCLAQDRQPGAGIAKQAATGSQSSTGAAVEAMPQAGDPAKSSKPEGTALPADERKTQISVESTHLLAMALALKAEVDKTNKDTLSVNVIRKADEIEKLAKMVREKVKPGPG